MKIRAVALIALCLLLPRLASAAPEDPHCGLTAAVSRLNIAHAQIINAKSEDYVRAAHRQINDLLRRVDKHNVAFTFQTLIGTAKTNDLISLIDHSIVLHRIGAINGTATLKRYASNDRDKIDHDSISGVIESLNCNVPIYLTNFKVVHGAASQDSGQRDVRRETEPPLARVLINAGIVLAVIGLLASGLYFLARRRKIRRKRHQILQRVSVTLTPAGMPSTSASMMAVDISLQGVRLRHGMAHAPDIGNEVAFELAGLRLTGTIRWSDLKHFGVLLDTSLAPEALSQIRKKPKEDMSTWEAEVQSAALATLVPT